MVAGASAARATKVNKVNNMAKVRACDVTPCFPMLSHKLCCHMRHVHVHVAMMFAMFPLCCPAVDLSFASGRVRIAAAISAICVSLVPWLSPPAFAYKGGKVRDRTCVGHTPLTAHMWSTP